MAKGSSFGGTVKLNGEDEYKKALRDITSNLKLVSSELKLTNTEFSNGDKNIKQAKTSYDSILCVSFFRFAQLHLRLLSRNEEDEDPIRLTTDRADYTNWFRLALIYDQLRTRAPFWNRCRSLRADCR